VTTPLTSVASITANAAAVVPNPADTDPIGTAAVAESPGPGRAIPEPEPAAPKPRRARRHLSKKTWVGFGIIAFFVLMAFIGPSLAPYNPSAATGPSLAGPSASHWLGTTQTSQDVLSQLLVGTRTTLVVGFLAGLIATVLSVLVGVTSGYLGGWWDESLSVLANLFLVIPALPLLIVLTFFVPKGGPLVIALVISVTGWAWGARVLRAQTLSMRRRDFVEAARIAGERGWRIILFEILPNEAAVVVSSFLFTVLFAVLTLIALDFLGLVNVSGAWSWGLMLYWAQSDQALAIGAWSWFVPPGLCIALLGVGLTLANFGLDEFIDPRLRAAGVTRRRDRRLIRMGYTPVHRTEVQRDPIHQDLTPTGRRNPRARRRIP
jgi:peptide/nickel transport system permease protein